MPLRPPVERLVESVDISFWRILPLWQIEILLDQLPDYRVGVSVCLALVHGVDCFFTIFRRPAEAAAPLRRSAVPLNGMRVIADVVQDAAMSIGSEVEIVDALAV